MPCHADRYPFYEPAFGLGRLLSAVGGRDCTPMRMKRSADFPGPSFCITSEGSIWHILKYKQCSFDDIPFTTIRKSTLAIQKLFKYLSLPTLPSTSIKELRAGLCLTWYHAFSWAVSRHGH